MWRVSILFFSLMIFFSYKDGFSASVDLRPQMTPVRSQGERNTCSSFAATALMENLVFEATGQKISLSPAYNYWVSKEKALDTPFLKQMYSNIDALVGFLAVKGYAFGSMLEEQWPYSSKNRFQQGDPQCTACAQENGDCPSVCYTDTPPEGAQELAYRLKMSFVPRDQMGSYLLKNKRPLVFNLQWFFAANDSKGNFRMPTTAEVQDCYTNPKQKTCGGHVVLLVGYDSKIKKFIFRNSWGPNWGDQGYGTVPEEYLVNYCEVCPYLKDFDRFNPEEKEFLLQASQGASGELDGPSL